MTYNTSDLEHSALILPIVQQARITAEQLASKQLTPAKAAQVRLNTLAVWVMQDYLQMMGISTSLDGCDSWNPVMRLCSDVADLTLPGIGRLECRPVMAAAQACPVPPEVWTDRIGYVVIQFDEALQTATLLGFTPTAAIESLPLSQLQDPEALFDHLYGLQQAELAEAELPQASPQTALESTAAPASRLQINLGQWLDNITDAGWQTLDSLLNSTQLNPAFAFRGSPDANLTSEAESRIRRAKLIDLGGQLTGQPVLLLIALQPDPDPSAETQITVQVHPTDDRSFLPANLQLIVLDDAGTPFLEAQSRPADNYLQLQLSGYPGETFSIRLAISDTRFTETFVI